VAASTYELEVEFVCVTETLEFESRFKDQFSYTVSNSEFITPTWKLVQTPACTNQVYYDLIVTQDKLEFFDNYLFSLNLIDDSIGFMSV
jgi:hypothetical protein